MPLPCRLNITVTCIHTTITQSYLHFVYSIDFQNLHGPYQGLSGETLYPTHQVSYNPYSEKTINKIYEQNVKCCRIIKISLVHDKANH